jgi:hypothetical protein
MNLFASSSLILTPTAYKANKLYSIVPTNRNGDFTFTRATTATRINSGGLVETVASGVPRLDYSDSTPAWLFEPEKTNLVLYSNDFSQSNWGKANCTITSNFAISPDGSQNAAKLTANGTDPYLEQSTNTYLSNFYTLSVYAKGVGSTIGKTCLFVLIGDGYTGAVSSNFTLTSEWERFTATLNLAVMPTGSAFFRVDLPDVAVVGDEVLLYGFQAEFNVFATSYIPTTTSVVTRNREVCATSDIYTKGLITSAGGTWFIDQSSENTGNYGLEYSIFSLPYFGVNTIYLYISTNNYFYIRKQDNSSLIIDQLIPNSNVQRVKIVIRWNTATSTLDVFFNGILTNTFPSQTFANYGKLAITDENGGGTYQPHRVNSCMLFPTPLSDAECIALTSPTNYISYSNMALNLNYIIQ